MFFLVSAGLEKFVSSKASPLSSVENTASEKGGEMFDASVTIEVIKSCLGKTEGTGKCLDLLFGPYMKTHSSIEALRLLDQYGKQESSIEYSCHPVAHSIGRETFLQKGSINDAFLACDQTCHSGCYHGSVERFLLGDKATSDESVHVDIESLKEKTRQACDPNQPTSLRFQCLHGLGHAMVFFSDYILKDALVGCDALEDQWSRSSCYGGAFMENIFASDRTKRDLHPTNVHYPCDALGDQYKNDCYMMQTTRMSEMGLGTDKLLVECRKAGAYREVCVQSIGRDLASGARIGDPKNVANSCALGQDPLERNACIRGVTYALLDTTWDGQFAFPFCESISDEGEQQYCFEKSREYLQYTFSKSADFLKAECQKYVPASKVCVE